MQPERSGTSANGDEIPIPKVHRRRMHFRRSNRLSALVVRPVGKRRKKKKKGTEKRKKEEKRGDDGGRPRNGGRESSVLEFNSARNYIRPDRGRLFARGLS